MDKDKWHDRLHLVALENGIIGHFLSIIWKRLARQLAAAADFYIPQNVTW